MQMELTGKKVRLMPMTVEDTDDIVRWRNKDFVRNNFIYRGEFTKEVHLNWIKTRVETGEVIQFIIYRLQDEKKIGSVYLRDVNIEFKEAEYGIFIGEEDALGKGYGSESCILIVEYAKDVLKLKRLRLRLLKKNEPARRSYENAGFRLTEGKTDIQNGEEVIFMEIGLNEN